MRSMNWSVRQASTCGRMIAVTCLRLRGKRFLPAMIYVRMMHACGQRCRCLPPSVPGRLTACARTTRCGGNFPNQPCCCMNRRVRLLSCYTLWGSNWFPIINAPFDRQSFCSCPRPSMSPVGAQSPARFAARRPLLQEGVLPAGISGVSRSFGASFVSGWERVSRTRCRRDHAQVSGCAIHAAVRQRRPVVRTDCCPARG